MHMFKLAHFTGAQGVLLSLLFKFIHTFSVKHWAFCAQHLQKWAVLCSQKKFCTEMQPKGIWCKIRQSSICETKTGQEYKTVEPVEAQFSCFAQIIQGITNLPHIVAHLSESVKTGSNAYKVASCRKDQGCTPAAPTFFALYCHAIVLTHCFKSDTEKGMFFFWAEIKAKSKVPSWFWSNEESLRKKREAKEKEQLHWQPCFSQAIFPLRSNPHSNSSIILGVNLVVVGIL